MAFDQATRNRLQKFVSDARGLLVEEFSRQMQHDYGMDPDTGAVSAIDSLSHLTDSQHQTAKLLRETMAHYQASSPGNDSKEILGRIVREQAFTILNRLCALRMAEARGILIESIAKGYNSKGFQLYARLAGTSLGETGDTYRNYLFSIFDEFSIDLAVLFDRYSPMGRLFPKETALLALLSKINDFELESLWAEDETIGWIYQYFNSAEERKQMRSESQAPRNSRELAVRNQFFTPRYVVEFLTDNTLGRIWYEMTQGQTILKDQCRYLVRRPDEVFLWIENGPVLDWFQGKELEREPKPGEIAHAVNGYLRAGGLHDGAEDWFNRYVERIHNQEAESFTTQEILDFLFVLHRADRFCEGLLNSHNSEVQAVFQALKIRIEKSRQESLTQEELLKLPVFIPLRFPKDPRDIKILDPACGSGHFLLYAFILLVTIYSEAWDQENNLIEIPTFRSKGLHPLREIYDSKESFMADVPRLIIEYNLHGIDIDPRAVQIAGLSLWLCAQRSWKEQNVKPMDRPQIRKSNIVCAEAMPGEKEFLKAFCETLKPRVLGQLVEIIFEKMELAGEAGSLLKIEEEIEEAVEQAREEFNKELLRRKEEAGYLPGFAPKIKQRSLFDFADLHDKTQFWQTAEEKILVALRNYAEQVEAEGGSQLRLFVEDAAKGFAFIDLCRKKYAVVLMNPPFGEFSKLYKAYARTGYPNSYNDILGAFVERSLLCLEDHGRLGAITSRTCFYLVSFTDWREKVILAEAALTTVADLGQGVMDDAMVEAAAYILERTRPTVIIPFIRSIAERDRQAVVCDCISAIKAAASEPHLFFARQDTFRKLAGAPFVYWTKSDDLDRFAALPTFEPEAAEVRQGLATGDDPRFVRAVWEVAEKDTQFVYYPTNGETNCRLNDPIVLAYQQRRKAGTPRWAFHVKSGASQPWYSPITLKIDWHQDGSQLRNFRDARGKLRSRPQNIAYYYRPGFSWTRRAARFYPYVIPGNCIPSVSRYMAFPEQGMDFDALGVSASLIASAFMRFYAEFWQRPNYLVENLKKLPWPELRDNARQFFRRLIHQEVEQRHRAYMNHEPFQEFLLPIKVKDFSNGGRSLAFDPKTLLGEEGERLVAKAYGFEQTAAMCIERDVVEALEYQHGIAVKPENTEGENGEQDTDGDADFVLDYSEQARVEALLSYFVGCIFGRWDVRIAIDPSLAPKLPDPFDPLPVCPPGMLVGPDGLPAEPNNIVSDEWLRSRPDANILPSDNALSKSIILDSDYPLRISWNGILVDDPGLNHTQPHRDDIVRRVREVLDLLWKEKAHEIEQEACDILGVSDLRDYYRKPAKLFQDHLKRYSKSRRKAPIYWPLSTASGSYTIWIYYHRLTNQTLYTCVNNFVDPKLKQVSDDMENLRKKTTRTSQEEKDLEKLSDFALELKDFREELLRIAKFWKPNLNDGVQITAAPLWKLFQYKPWQKTLKQTWKDLEKGKYDWAHLAYSIWPERVIRASHKDRSYAIAHDLEKDLWEEIEVGTDRQGNPKSKWVPKKLSTMELGKIIQEKMNR